MDYRSETADLATEFKGMPKHALNIGAKQRMLSELKRYQESVYPTRSRSERSHKLGTLGAGVAAVIAVCGFFWGYEHQGQGSQQVRHSTTADQSTTAQATNNPYVQPQWIPSGYKVKYQQILTNGNSSSYEFEEVKNVQNMYSVTEIKTPAKLNQFLHATGMFTPGTFPWMKTRPFRHDGIEIGRDISTVGNRTVNYEFTDGTITYSVIATGGNAQLDLSVIDSLLHHTAPIANNTPVVDQNSIPPLPQTTTNKSQ